MVSRGRLVSEREVPGNVASVKGVRVDGQDNDSERSGCSSGAFSVPNKRIGAGEAHGGLSAEPSSQQVHSKHSCCDCGYCHIRLIQLFTNPMR